MKRRLEDLALLGGRPAFTEPVRVGRPNLGDVDRFLGRVRRMLESGQLTNQGPLVEQFERRIAALTGTAECVATCNATAALQIAVRAAGLSGEVIVPAYTYPATAHVLAWQHIKPVFCDVDRRTGNIDVDAAEASITPRTTGILAVHVWGRPCDVDRLEALAERRGLTLLFDAAHAFASQQRGRPVGRFGAGEVFSFHATKFINSFEGGALVTDDPGFAHRARTMRMFGYDEGEVVSLGLNGKMSEVCAAMGLTSLEKLDDFLAVNARHYARYEDGLGGLGGIRLQRYGPDERPNLQYVVIEVDRCEVGLSREEMMRLLAAENVITRAHFAIGCHRMRPYGPPDARGLPNTDALAAGVIMLPTGGDMTPAQVSQVCDLIRFVTEHGPDVAARLP